MPSLVPAVFSIAAMVAFGLAVFGVLILAMLVTAILVVTGLVRKGDPEANKFGPPLDAA